MAHEKCTQNCTSAHVRKYPLDLVKVATAAANLNLSGQAEAPVKNIKKGEKKSYHAVLPIDFIPPQNMLAKLAAKPNVVKLRIVEHGVDAGKVTDVKLCMQCSESVCADTPSCPAKASVKAYLYGLQTLKVGKFKVM